MDTLYFAGFCIFIALIIVWGFLKDDHEEFNQDLGKKKFSLKQPTSEETEPPKDDDTPQANLL